MVLRVFRLQLNDLLQRVGLSSSPGICVGFVGVQTHVEVVCPTKCFFVGDVLLGFYQLAFVKLGTVSLV